jgi:hypothetical protein
MVGEDQKMRRRWGSSSFEKDSPVEIVAMRKEEEASGHSMTSDLEKESIMAY